MMEDFSNLKDMPALMVSLVEPRTVHDREGIEFTVFADDSGTFMAVGSQGVVSISKEDYSLVRLVNSSIGSFHKFQEIYFDSSKDLQDDNDEIALPAVSKVRLSMVATDPSAMIDPNNWWPAILEQVEEGNL